MPQTVALQRGTVSVSADNTTQATLFTQSGGIATRVIINSLTVGFSPSLQSSRDLCIMVSLQQSGGHNSLLGYIFQTSYGNSNFQFAPGVNTVNSFYGTPSSGNAPTPSNKLLSSQPVISGGGSGGIGNASAANVQFRYPSTTGEGVGNINTINSNFYMGPSDSIRMKIQGWYTSGKGAHLYSTATISYSFTTITES